jgi:hypothetical protein
MLQRSKRSGLKKSLEQRVGCHQFSRWKTYIVKFCNSLKCVFVVSVFVAECKENPGTKSFIYTTMVMHSHSLHCLPSYALLMFKFMTTIALSSPTSASCPKWGGGHSQNARPILET